MSSPEEKDEHIHVIIKRRPGYVWLLWGLWLCLEIFFLQNALASLREFEPRAAILYGLICVVLFIFAGTLWAIKRLRL